MRSFDLFIGVDYSGAKTPTSRLKNLQVYSSKPGESPIKWVNPNLLARGKPGNWTRIDIAQILLDQSKTGRRFLAGIDHCFSFPESYIERYALPSWSAFLDDFVKHWPTDQPDVWVESVRSGDMHRRGGLRNEARVGKTSEFRICERWTSSAKSVFQFDVQGSVAHSSHAGIPWLKRLRDEAGDRIHFWPFDGWEPAPGKSVVVEIYPSMFRRRFPSEGRTADEQDAYSVACWMAQMSERGVLAHYFAPPLSVEERSVAGREGWIFGVI